MSAGARGRLGPPQAGSGPIGAVFGVMIFLGFLLLAAQALVHLYALSTVTAIAYDEARRVSAVGGDCADAGVRVSSRLGRWAAEEMSVVCSRGEVETTVMVSGPSPARGLAWLRAGVAEQIERAATMRTEHGQTP